MGADQNVNPVGQDDLQRRCFLSAGRQDLHGEHCPPGDLSEWSLTNWFLTRCCGITLRQHPPPRVKGRLRKLPLSAPIPHAASVTPPAVDHFTPILLLRRTPRCSTRHGAPLG